MWGKTRAAERAATAQATSQPAGLQKRPKWCSMAQVSTRTLTSGNGQPTRADSHPVRKFAGIFDGYRRRGPYASAFDEMFENGSTVRTPYKGIYAELAPSDASELAARSD